MELILLMPPSGTDRFCVAGSKEGAKAGICPVACILGSRSLPIAGESGSGLGILPRLSPREAALVSRPSRGRSEGGISDGSNGADPAGDEDTWAWLGEPSLAPSATGREESSGYGSGVLYCVEAILGDEESLLVMRRGSTTEGSPSPGLGMAGNRAAKA